MSTHSGPEAVPASSPAPALAPLHAQVPPGAPGEWLPEGAWQTPPAPRPPVGDRIPAAALWVFWAGLLGISVLRAVPGPGEWDIDAHLTYVYVVNGILLAVLAVAGFQSRRRGLPVAAILCWLAGGVLLLASVQGWTYVMQTYGLDPDTIGHLARANLTLLVTLFAAAYFAVRRAPSARYAFLLAVLVVALAWFELAALVFDTMPGSLVAYRVRTAIFLPGGIALMGGVLALAGRIGRGPAARPVPMPGNPGATAYAPAPGPVGRPSTYGAQTTNTLAVVALVLGLVGVSLGGVICGHLALGQIRRTGERGSGMAIAGLVLGYVGLALITAFLLFLVVVASSAPSY